MSASDRRKLWICRFAWTTQTRCPHTHSSDRKKRRKRLEDSFEEGENRTGRRLYTLIPKAPGPTDGVHLIAPARYLSKRKDFEGLADEGRAKKTVQHVHVGDGGQAIVGNVNAKKVENNPV